MARIFFEGFSTKYFFFFFSLFDVLRNEARVMEGLHRLGIEGLSLHNILKLNIQPSEADYAVDIRSPAISVGILLECPRASGQALCYGFTMKGKLFLPSLLLGAKIYHNCLCGAMCI